MKKLIYLLTLSLFVCLSCSKDEPIESVEQIETSTMKSPEFLIDQFKSSNSAKSSPNKGGNNENGVQFVSVYSDFFPDYRIYASFGIPNTDMQVWALYPTNGEDEAKVNGDWIMGNWTLREPRVYILDWSLETPSVIYSNWCEEEKAGYFHQSSRGKLETHDYDGDGQIDVWRLDPNHEDSDFQGQGRTVLTDGQVYDNWPYWPTLGNCKEATTEVELSWNIHIKNGIWRITVKLDGETYK